MPDFRTMFDPSEYLFAHDLAGREVVLTIASIGVEVLTGSGGKTARKPVASFVGKTKRLALNRTNCKTLVQLTGSKNTDDWAGVSIVVYPTTTQMGPDMVDCIRIKAAPAKAAP